MLKAQLIAENEILEQKNKELALQIENFKMQLHKKDEQITSLSSENVTFKTLVNCFLNNSFVKEQIKDIVREMMNDGNESSINYRMESILDKKLDEDKYNSWEE